MEKKILANIFGEDSEILTNMYLVGGCVRDRLLGYKRVNDIDVVYFGNKEDISKVLGEESVEKDYYYLYRKSYNMGHTKIDIYIPKQKSDVSTDWKTRDFCCNALYKNVITGEILDPSGRGISDCKKKLLTPTTPKSLYEDPLRILRAIRFQFIFFLKIDSSILSLINKDFPGWNDIPIERIRDEFSKIIVCNRNSEAVCSLVNNGLMERIVPELVKYKDFEHKSKYHSLNWLRHTLSVLKGQHDLESSLAALLHDVAKPTCYQEKSDGSRSYHGHEKASSILAESILRNLRYPKELIRRVSLLISNHMFLKDYYDYDKCEYTGGIKPIRKLYLNLEEDIILLKKELFLIDSDNNSHSPEWCMRRQVDQIMSEYIPLLEREIETKKKSLGFPITGVDIISEFDVQGKLVGEIKAVMLDWYISNSSLTKEDLINKFKRLINKYPTLWVSGGNICLNSPNSFPQKKFPINYDNDEVFKVSSIYYPSTLTKLVRDKDISRSFSKFLDNIEGDFENIVMNGDGQDIYLRIDWKDGDSTEIV